MTRRRTENVALVAEAKPGEAEGRARARTVLRPTVGAACAAYAIEKELTKEIPIQDLVDELAAQVKTVQDGSLARPEALLTAQAHTLDLLFNRLTRRAMACDTVEPFDANMRMALRAQSQCSRTLEVLAGLKNPPVVIAKQANFTTGPQQNNVGVSRGENEIKQNQQSQGATSELLPDARAQGNACGNDRTLEAVGEVHRAKVAGR